jgi:hypothetical protein
MKPKKGKKEARPLLTFFANHKGRRRNGKNIGSFKKMHKMAIPAPTPRYKAAPFLQNSATNTPKHKKGIMYCALHRPSFAQGGRYLKREKRGYRRSRSNIRKREFIR